MGLSEKARKELERFNARADADKSGNVSAAEVKDYVEASIRKSPFESIAKVAALAAIGTAALIALYMLVR